MARKSNPYGESGIVISTEVRDRLKQHCAKSKVSMKKVAGMAINIFLDRLERENMELVSEEKIKLRKKFPHDKD